MGTKKALQAIISLAVAAAGGSAAAAGHHQICYQDWTSGSMSAVFACRADDPAVTCSISLAGSATYGPLGFVKTIQLPSSGAFTASIQFSDGTSRSCTVSALDPSLGAGTASPGAALIGYTTDASGRVMTGVWTHRSNQNYSRVHQTISVPWDFVAVGGGVVGAEVPSGALIYESQPSSQYARDWLVGTQDAIDPQPHDNDAYVIGLKIDGLNRTDLDGLISRSVVGSDTTGSNWLDFPSASVATPADRAALGGGLYSFAPGPGSGFGQYATGSSPNVVHQFCHPACEETFSITGWSTASKDHGALRPGWVDAHLVTIARQFDIGGSTFHVVGLVTQATSPVAQHPSVVVSGNRGEYALTGVGASVDWESYGRSGNLLWKLAPRPDIAGVEAASKDHAYYSPATITGYAVGIKLVPGPVPTWTPPVIHP
jgi:hypothetical protein